MFCFLAGAMITVSATAVGVWVDFPMPSLQDRLPNSFGWCLAVFGVGLAISIVAAYGYQTVAKFANIAAPWMVLVFLAFGLVGLRNFIAATGAEIHSCGDLWQLVNTQIWKGGEPLPGQTKFTFLHVMFFAWFCNMAMHVGMSDLTIFRFAKKSWYGIATSSGMYIGHFMAWISASILYAYQLHVTPENTDVLPGPLAYQACGIAGLICVIIAGWTTANPTIYRAGLAFQAIMPRQSRFTATLLAGLVATIAGMFPAIAMKMLDFVALYGLVLMPMGAVVLVDFYFMRKLGLKANYAEQSGERFNWAAGLTWLVTLGVCLLIVFQGSVEVFFIGLPGWFFAVIFYIGASFIYQRRLYAKRPFRFVLQVISWLAIAALILPGAMFLTGQVELDQVKWIMLVATVVWFAATPLWMGQKKAS